MDLLIESKTLYAVSFFSNPGNEKRLSEFCYRRVIAWGVDPSNAEDKLLKDVVYPWVVDEYGALELCNDLIAGIRKVPSECQEFVWSGDARADAFNDLYEAGRLS